MTHQTSRTVVHFQNVNSAGYIAFDDNSNILQSYSIITSTAIQRFTLIIMNGDPLHIHALLILKLAHHYILSASERRHCRFRYRISSK